jgi:hypothetical protein
MGASLVDDPGSTRSQFYPTGSEADPKIADTITNVLPVTPQSDAKVGNYRAYVAHGFPLSRE